MLHGTWNATTVLLTQWPKCHANSVKLHPAFYHLYCQQPTDITRIMLGFQSTDDVIQSRVSHRIKQVHGLAVCLHQKGHTVTLVTDHYEKETKTWSMGEDKESRRVQHYADPYSLALNGVLYDFLCLHPYAKSLSPLHSGQ